MTLGGLALAVGILVDDATVEIENIHRNLALGKPMIRAILDGAHQIAVPAFVSTLSICIVFVPIFFLSGTAKYLFQPLAMAVIFAMLASYLLSRTVIPTMVKFLLRGHMEEIDTSLGRSLNSSDSAYGPRAESGGCRTLPRGGKTLRRGAARGTRGLCAFQQDSFAPSPPFFPVFTTASIAFLRKFAIVMLKHCAGVSIIAVLFSQRWAGLC
jgi:multidrug efflux pump subunit AcrB